jgi:hypothetical protein
MRACSQIQARGGKMKETTNAGRLMMFIAGVISIVVLSLIMYWSYFLTVAGLVGTGGNPTAEDYAIAAIIQFGPSIMVPVATRAYRSNPKSNVGIAWTIAAWTLTIIDMGTNVFAVFTEPGYRATALRFFVYMVMAVGSTFAEEAIAWVLSETLHALGKLIESSDRDVPGWMVALSEFVDDSNPLKGARSPR